LAGQNGGVRLDLAALAVSEAVRRQFDFLVTAHRLTGVSRVNRLTDGSRAENSAEHSWHLALMAMVLAAEHAPGVDLGRVLSMLVIHDLVEVEAGDVPIYDEQVRLAAAVAEDTAAVALFGRLPAEQGDALLALWREFEAAGTAEARFAKAVDRLQPLLMHCASDGTAWAERGITAVQERRLMAVIERYWPSLGPLADSLITDAHQRGYLT
jgi:5'-deoxynucleotidase YfbR-like HD superfamily hydrolase